MARDIQIITVGVLALQGAFSEHIQLLRRATQLFQVTDTSFPTWQFIEVRTPQELELCEGLIIPGGESTTMALVAARSGMLEPLREFVKVQRRPTWGTCAGLILLAEAANRTKKGGQELIGGIDVRVNRNHFGRQVESFQAALDLPFLADLKNVIADAERPFRSVFIRAPVVEKILPHVDGIQAEESKREETIVAPSKVPRDEVAQREIKADVEVLGRVPRESGRALNCNEQKKHHNGDIVAVRQGNVFGTSFHPELTADPRIHMWWLLQVSAAISRRR